MTQKQQHPITPSTKLVEKWWDLIPDSSFDWKRQLCTQAAQWGADQELEACCKWTAIVGGADALRLARRPKPPSLKEELLQKLERISDVADGYQDTRNAIDDLRSALETLND
jgi:hypothetical protein